VADFAGGGAVNREYEVTINGGTYAGILKLHYEDGELNGNTETALNLYQNTGASWAATTNTGLDATNNYVQFSPSSSMNGRWTLAGDNKIVLWNGSVSNVWSNPANWTAITGSPTIPPTGEEIVEIGNNNHSYEPTISSPVTVRSLQFNNTHASSITIGSGGSLTLNGNINGTWSGNATHTINVGAQSLTVNGQIYMSDQTTDHNININVNGGTVNVSGDMYMTGNAAFTCSGSSNLNIGGNFFDGGTFTAGSGTVTYNGSIYQTVAGLTYNNITFNKSSGLAESEADATINGHMDIQGTSVVDIDNIWQIAGNLSIASGAKMYFDHNFVHIYLSGDLSNSGFMSGDGSTFTLNGSNNQSISAAPLNILEINKSSGIATLTGNLNLKGNINILSGSLDLSTYTANRNSVGGSFQIANGASLIIGGANNYPSNFGSYTANAGSTTHYNGAIGQTITASNYGNLLFSNSTKTIGGDCNVAGNLTINNSASLDGSSYNISLLGNWNNNGTFTAGTSTIGFDGTNKFINGATSFYNAHISGSYTVNDINTSYTGMLQIFTGGSFNLGTAATTISGNLTNSGSLIGSGTVTFSGTSLQNIQAINSTAFYLSGTVNFNGTIAPVFNSNGTPHFNIVNINNTSASGITPSIGWVCGWHIYGCQWRYF
jgi:hypothetical protein